MSTTFSKKFFFIFSEPFGRVKMCRIFTNPSVFEPVLTYSNKKNYVILIVLPPCKNTPVFGSMKETVKMTEKKTIAEKIRMIRKTCGFTQQQVASVLNVDRSTYTYYETGKTTPDIHTVKLLANLFNLSIDDLLADEGAGQQMNDSASTCCAEPEDPSLPETANRLTRTERELLLYYRALPIQDRVKMMAILHDLAEQAGKK